MTEALQSNLLGLSLQELTCIVEAAGEPSYRGRQLYDAIYRRRVQVAAQVSNLPHHFLAGLESQGFSFGLPKIENKFTSRDGTVRYLIACADGQTVETVWMPQGDGGEAGDGSDAGRELDSRARGRATICVSSQLGCAVDCQFCLTALLGLKRNLTAGEIVGQVCAVLNDQSVSPPVDRINLVFMGMGEPFLNYENFMKAVQLLIDGVGVAESRMTVSTAGIVPRICDFGSEPVRPKLAISLNAPNDELRTRLMPLNRKWNLESLIAAARNFPLRSRERLTFEYVLLDNVNDSIENARQLARLIAGIRCKVNLIALNPGPGIAFGTPAEARTAQFQKALIEAGVPAFVRRPRGRDIYAACGQLKQMVELRPLL
jgi:23S rRNA (adenine2503-C2)-methyltransferase